MNIATKADSKTACHANMAGENPATSDGAKCTGQSHQLPGQQLDQVGVLHRSRLLANMAERAIRPFIIGHDNYPDTGGV